MYRTFLFGLVVNLAAFANANDETAPIPPALLSPVNLVESPDYSDETQKFEVPTTELEKTQYEALEDGRPPLEKRDVKEESATGALYHQGPDLFISPESSITQTHEEIEDTEQAPPDGTSTPEAPMPLNEAQ